MGDCTLRKTGTDVVTWFAPGSTFEMSANANIDIHAGNFVCESSNIWTNNLADMTVATGAIFIGGGSNDGGDTLTVGANNGSVAFLNLNGFSETVGSIAGDGLIDNLTGAGSPVFTFGINYLTTLFGGVMKNTTCVMNVTKTSTGKIYLDGYNTNYGQTYVEDGFVEVRDGSIISYKTKAGLLGSKF